VNIAGNTLGGKWTRSRIRVQKGVREIRLTGSSFSLLLVWMLVKGDPRREESLLFLMGLACGGTTGLAHAFCHG
jgi:hypothetical protein